MPKIIASALNADFSNWKQWLPELEEAKASGIQWDIMDNKYVPNKGLDEKLIGEFRKRTKMLFESHLMVQKPEEYVEKHALMGSDLFIFHIETTKNPLKLIAQINDNGMKAGIAINNKTPAEKIFQYLDKVDLALVMTVEAGFGGQSFLEKNLEKVKAIRRVIDYEALDCNLEVDGGINLETAKKSVKAGANVLVSGAGIFKHPKGIKEAVNELKALK